MATKRKSTSKAKPKAAPKTPMSAQEKEARAATTAADNATLEAQGAVVGRQTKGAFTQRRLRMSGSDLARYIMPGGYEDDPGLFRAPPTGGAGTKRTTTRSPAPPAKPRPKQAPPKMKPVSHKQAVRKQNKLSDARGREMERIRKAQQRKAAAARSKAGQSQQRKARSTPVKPKPYAPVGGKAPVRL